MKRYISIDIVKGFSMFLVLLFHVLTRSLDMSIINNTLTDFSLINLPLYVLIILLGYIGQFDVVYICVSAFGNIFSIQKQWNKFITNESTSAEKNDLSRRIMKTQLIRGAFIAFLGYFSEWILNGMIIDLISQKENWATSSIGALFFAQILTVIAINNVILSFIYLLCLRKGKSKQIPIILLSLLFGIIAITPGIIELIKLSPSLWTNLSLNWQERSVGMNIAIFFITPFIRRFTPIFPNFSASVLGAIIALKFYKEGIQKKFLNWLVLTSIFLLLIAVFFAHFENGENSRFLDYNLGSFLFAYSGGILYILFFIYFFEVRGSKKTIQYSKFFRRIGIFTLSIWCLQWLIILPAMLVQVIINWISRTWTPFADSPLINNGLNIWQFMIALIFITGFYYGILALWEKVRYIGTFEWITVKLISKFHKGAKNRLNMEQSLYNVESYVLERLNFYKWWQLSLGFTLFFVYSVIHALFYLI